ncbi:uncharacterized protein LOC111942869 [Cyanistes caeruleus]|uniref:uncharacterized protein LOC111942869 n=1 Tax=Cyanistes caeruleus TaxID=156563 RepID=UPI000CDA0FB4|nr:uncharacterized protein LOC111942869 [Cyanistes caeruleus]
MSDQELSSVEEAIVAVSGDSPTDEELSSVEEDIEGIAEDNTSDEKLSPVEEAFEVAPEDSTSDLELSPAEEAIVVISGYSPTDEELSSVEEDIEVAPEDSTSDVRLYQMENDKEHSRGDSKSDKELSPGEKECEKELSQWLEHEAGELCQWEEQEDKELCHWEEEDEALSHSEECQDGELTRMALLGGMDRDSSSSPELPEMEEISRHQKVVEWLEANFPNDYGVEEEEENEGDRYQGLSKLKWCKEETPWQDLLDSLSSLAFNVGDNVLSKGKHCKVQEMEDDIQDNSWNNSMGLVDDEDPLEAPSCSRHVGAGVAAEAAHALPKLAAAKEKPSESLGPEVTEVTEAQSQVSEKRPSRFRRALRALRGLFRCRSVARGPFRCPHLVSGLFRCPCLGAQLEE